jgi:molybdate transport system substrate-binding protein
MRITGISSMATRSFLADLGAGWNRRGGDEAQFESVGGVTALARVRDGEPFDVVVLADDAIETLAAADRVVADSRVALVRSDVVVAVRQGERRAEIESENALRETLRCAATIGVSTGPSGVALRRLFARCGVDCERLVEAPPGVPVATLLARGEVDIGFQRRSELIHAVGVDVVGAMPPGLEIATTFSGALCTRSTRPDPARAPLAFLGSPATDAARRRHGFMAP